MTVSKACFGLVLFLQVLVHPLVHEAALSSGTLERSVSVAVTSSGAHDCHFCRIVRSLFPSADFVAPEAGDLPSPSLIVPRVEPLEVAQLHLPSRAPPVS